MSDPDKKPSQEAADAAEDAAQDAPNDAPDEVQDEAQDEAQEDAAEAARPEPDEPARDPVAELQAQVAELKDQLLRALAETENLRRRSQRECEDTARYAAAPFAKDIIEVADNLGRALAAVPAEAVEADEHLKTLMTGVGMTEKALQSVFEKHNIRRIDPMGERLDPHSHEAIFEVPDPSQPPGTIVQVVRAGYRLHDRLLRAAQVGVAKGGQKTNGTDEGAKDGASEGDRREPGARVDTTA